MRSTSAIGDDNDSFENVDLTEIPDNKTETRRTRTESVGESKTESNGESSASHKERQKENLRRVKTMNEGNKRPTTRKVKKKSSEQAPPLSPLCEICYSDYTDPKILPCKHTFCKLCLEKFVNPKLMLECPSCRKQIQLSVLGVSELPDNLEVKKDESENSDDNQNVQSNPNHYTEAKDDGGRRMSLTGINIGDQMNLTRELQVNYSKLDAAERNFHVSVEETTDYMDEVISVKIAELTQKRVELKSQMKDILKKKVERHERWRKRSEDLINQIENNKENNVRIQMNHPISEQIHSLDLLCFEELRFDASQLQLCLMEPNKKTTKVGILKKENSRRELTRKVSLSLMTPLTPFTPEFYKAASMEEIRKLKWSACLQPRCARLCPWSGHLWVCAAGSREIGVFDSDDTFIQSFSNPAFLFPCSVDFNMETMEAFILDKRQNMIFVVSSTFNVTRSIGKQGRRHACFSSPSSLLLDAKGRLIVSDDGNDRIQILTVNGDFVNYIGVTALEDGKGYSREISSPQGLSLSLDGKALAVVDKGNTRIRIFSVKSGRQLQCFGYAGKSNGQFEKPLDLAWDPLGHLLVLDEERIQVFTEAGEFLRSFKTKAGINAMQVVGSCLLLSDTYCVIKTILKTK